jgi:hypothetical protein
VSALFPWITTIEAAPPVARFDRWVPRTLVSELLSDDAHFHAEISAAVVASEHEVEVRGTHSSKTATSGAASVVVI